MGRGKIIAIGIGIAVAMIAGFGMAISMQPDQNASLNVAENGTAGQHFEVGLSESVGVGDRAPP